MLFRSRECNSVNGFKVRQEQHFVTVVSHWTQVVVAVAVAGSPARHQQAGIDAGRSVFIGEVPLTETAICCSIPINFTGADYTMANNAVSGNTIIGNYNKRPLKQPIDYCFMYQMSQAAAMKQRR